MSDHVICPYNASHHVSMPEMEYHISVCTDRNMVEMEKYSWRSHPVQQQGNLTRPNPVQLELHKSEEDWENLDTSAASCTGLGTSLDTTKDTLDQAIHAVNDLTFGHGKKMEINAREPLRRPSIGRGALFTSCTGLGTSLDTTKDTLDQAIDAVGNLTLGHGKKMELNGREPQRRPSVGRGALINSWKRDF